MVIPEEDIPGKEEKVNWIASEVWVRLHKLACEDPSTHALQCERDTILICKARRGDKIQQRHVSEQSEISEACEVHSVYTPRLLNVHTIQEPRPEGVSEEAGGVRPPCGSHPPETLTEIARERTNSRLNHRIIGVLELDFPPLPNHPPRDEVVVVRVERPETAKEEPLVLESRLEGRVSEDLCSIGGGAARNDEHPAVDVACGGDFEVVALEVQAADEVPEALEVESRWLADNTFICAHHADVGVFEGGEDGREEVGAWPEDRRVDSDDDIGLDVGHRMADLHTLVALALLDDADLVPVFDIERSTDHLAQREVLLPHRRDDDGSRLVSEDGIEALSELLIFWIWVCDRDDDRAVAAQNGRVSWYGNGFV